MATMNVVPIPINPAPSPVATRQAAKGRYGRTNLTAAVQRHAVVEDSKRSRNGKEVCFPEPKRQIKGEDGDAVSRKMAIAVQDAAKPLAPPLRKLPDIMAKPLNRFSGDAVSPAGGYPVGGKLSAITPAKIEIFFRYAVSQASRMSRPPLGIILTAATMPYTTFRRSSKTCLAAISDANITRSHVSGHSKAAPMPEPTKIFLGEGSNTAFGCLTHLNKNAILATRH